MLPGLFHRPPIWQALLHPFRPGVGVKMLGATWPLPLARFLPVLMVWVAQCLQIVPVTVGTADIFGRAGPLALQAEGIPCSFLGPKATFEDDLVFPAVAEVVFVVETEPLAVSRDDLADSEPP